MTKAPLKSMAFAISSLLLLGTVPAYAGADAIRAEAYFNAISGGDAETIASFYAEDAEFHWVGGPLAGVYKGKDKIRGVWEKFSQAAGALNHEVLQLSESVNGKVTTITARVKFKGEGEVPVKFVMIYKEGKIASEVWQVDKASPATARNEAKPEAKVETKPEPKPQAKAEPAAPRAPVPTAAVITPAPPEGAAPPEGPAPDQVAEAQGDGPAQGSDDDDYLPKTAKPGQTGAPASAPTAAAPATPAKPAAERKAKTAEAPKARKKRYRDYDDDDYGYGYGGYGGYRGYRRGDGYGYGGGWGGYGYGGGYGGYGRYGGY